MRSYQAIGALMIFLGTMLLLAVLPLAVSRLLPDSGLHISRSSIALFGLFCLARAWSDTYATALMSLSRMKILWLYIPFQAVISLAGQYYFSRHYGLNGILLGLLLSFALTAVWILPVYFGKIMTELAAAEERG